MTTSKTPDACPGAASPFLGRFVDPVTGEPFADDEKCDADGVDLIGVDDGGDLWWGTPRAAYVLSNHWAIVRVGGFIGSARWDGFFVGTDDEAIDYARGHSVHVDHVESGETGTIYQLAWT